MKILLSFFVLSISINSFAQDSWIDKVIYGVDDRKDIFESTNDMYKQLANSTAAMISDSSLVSREDDTVLVSSTTLEQDGICADARFAKQVAAANCSGFLVGDQYLVTAGHCIQDLDDCERYSWVFGYANVTEEKLTQIIPKTEVYKCNKIVSRVLDRSTYNDFALVRLDRVVAGHTPLKFRTTGKIADKAGLVVIGHPSGLPTKIADGANVRSNTNKYYFQATLDTFGGNSGSAVFDSTTGVVEGILVRGETDYVNDPIQNCYRPKVCKVTECRGEDVTRITNIKELQKIIRK
ncbi:serine protease [Bacteriovorax sp. PP10]|uniref:Serine protease n=1 Tax=Bacteriovorax antarcticus TaxID=3088717 RepID=A0ABU5VTW6_9BACT|nr:serine protease [Bacteriovorax sp. PP10]MEA9356500.1 serine protease [Bacteriovorax sp. PP10]